MGGDNHDDCKEPRRQEQWYGNAMILLILLHILLYDVYLLLTHAQE
jgi:hypothetical protein